MITKLSQATALRKLTAKSGVATAPNLGASPAPLAPSRVPIPEISAEQLKKYEQQHVNSDVLRRRDSLKLAHLRKPLDSKNKDGTSNKFGGTALRKLPGGVLASALKRREQTKPDAERETPTLDQNSAAGQSPDTAKTPLRDLLKRAVERQGYNPDDPQQVQMLVQKRQGEQALFTRAESTSGGSKPANSWGRSGTV